MIDASIVSGIKPPQVRSPLELYGKILGYQGQQQDQQANAQQLQLGAQRLQEGQVALDQKKRDQEADTTLGGLLAKNTTTSDTGEAATNYPAVITGLAAAGHGKKALEVETQWRADQKTQVENDKSKLANAKEKLAMSSSAFGSLVNAPDDQLQPAYEQNRAELLQSGAFKPEEVPTYEQALQASGGDIKAWAQQQQLKGVDAAKQVEEHQKDLEFKQHLLDNAPALAEKKLKTAADEKVLIGRTLGVAQNAQQWDAGKQWLKEAGIKTDAIGEFSPESVTRVNQEGMTPDERAKAKQAEESALTPDQKNYAVAVRQGFKGTQMQFKAQEAAANRDPASHDLASQNTLDREATRFARTYETAAKDANSQLEKIADARGMINGNAEAQALGIPKVLTALVGGQGSGVRITKPELEAIARARGVAGDVEGFFNSISGSGKLTDSQKQQLTQILDDVKARLEKKRDLANDTLTKINSAGSREEIVGHDTAARQAISQMESGGGGASVITQKSKKTGAYRHSVDGGKTWLPGQQ